MKALRATLATTLLFVAPVHAVQCTLNVQGVAFGTYDVFSNQSLDSTGHMSVSCDAAASYTLAISPGGGTYAARFMASGPHRLGYNLYADAARTTVWGDGTAGSVTVPGSGPSANHTVFGRIPARQNVNVGAYSDSLVVTLTF